MSDLANLCACQTPLAKYLEALRIYVTRFFLGWQKVLGLGYLALPLHLSFSTSSTRASTRSESRISAGTCAMISSQYLIPGHWPASYLRKNKPTFGLQAYSASLETIQKTATVGWSWYLALRSIQLHLWPGYRRTSSKRLSEGPGRP